MSIFKFQSVLKTENFEKAFLLNKGTNIITILSDTFHFCRNSIYVPFYAENLAKIDIVFHNFYNKW